METSSINLGAAELVRLWRVPGVFECWSESLRWPVYKGNVSDSHEEVHQRDASRLPPDPVGLSDVVAPPLNAGPAYVPND